MNTDKIIIRWLGMQEYLPCWEAMRTFTDQRNPHTPDEIWVLEHPPVFTQGQNGKSEHLLSPGDIPVIPIDRGGQVTYHGPGQLVVYTLIDIQRKKYNVRQFVTLIEEAVIGLLAEHHIKAIAKRDAPGIYVNQEKICSIGLRIRRYCSYHGLALNINMDLEPFSRINPCGFPHLKMTTLSNLIDAPVFNSIGKQLTNQLIQKLGYTSDQVLDPLQNLFFMENNHAT